MNRLLYIILISAITVLGFTMYQQKDLGYISFRFAGTDFETNLVVFTAAVLCALFAVLLLIKIWQGLYRLFFYFGEKRKQRREEKAHQSLTQGLIEYAEGRFKQAEKILLQQIDYSDNKLLAYLSAARCAQQLGAHDRRDEYLRLAHSIAPQANIAIGLTKAELQLAHQQNEQALATLGQLHESAPEHTYVLKLLAQTYRLLQDWDNLEKLLPALKKHGDLSTEHFIAYEIDVCNGKLDKLGINQNSQLLIDYWKNLPSHLKSLPDVIEHYARKLIDIDAAGEAENILRLYLDKNWQESTIILYSELDVLVDNRQLEMMEGWLKDQAHNAWLLLALGKRCIALSLWGKARNYLEASLAINPVPETYLKLARLLEDHMDETENAQEYYRQGLYLLVEGHSEKNHRPFSCSDDAKPPLKIVKS